MIILDGVALGQGVVPRPRAVHPESAVVDRLIRTFVGCSDRHRCIMQLDRRRMRLGPGPRGFPAAGGRVIDDVAGRTLPRGCRRFLDRHVRRERVERGRSRTARPDVAVLGGAPVPAGLDIDSESDTIGIK